MHGKIYTRNLLNNRHEIQVEYNVANSFAPKKNYFLIKIRPTTTGNRVITNRHGHSFRNNFDLLTGFACK